MEFRKVLANTLLKLMEEDEKIIVLDADLGSPDGLSPVEKKYPERFIQVGIAEANMAGICAGLSAYGYKPIMVTFAPFATRRIFDQIAVSIAYAKQQVKIIGTDPGITAELNGGTHMTFEDIALMASLPDITIYDAVDDVQFGQALVELMNHPGNVYIRTPRKTRPTVFDENYKYTFGKADIVSEGIDISIIATGVLVHEAVLAKQELLKEGINAEIISANLIKPLDKETIIGSVKKTNCVVVAENHNVNGGLYSVVSSLLGKECPTYVGAVAVEDKFGQVGTYQDLLKAYHLTKDDIVLKVKEIINKKQGRN